MFSLRPVYYLGQCTYYELNIDTIIQKYCVNKDKPKLQCNGKCHLAKQLQITAPTNGQKSTNLLLEAFFPVFIVNLEPINFEIALLPTPAKTSFYYQNNYALEVGSSLLRPPIC